MFGQVVIGPPGSGKSTYCYGMYQFLSAIGRKCSIINLDPANGNLQYPACAFNIRDFITLEEIMEAQNLGPNGGLMYALESLCENSMETLLQQWHELGKDSYLLFDCPGQVELFTHHESFFKIFHRLSKIFDARLCVILLVDSVYLMSPSLYISVLLLSLRSMLQLDLPHINVLSKIDMLLSYGDLDMRLDYYTEVQDLKYLRAHLYKESPLVLGQNFVRLTEMIAEIVEDFNLVSFEVLAIENKKTMISLLRCIDKAIGYSFGSTEIGGDLVWSQAIRNSGSVEEVVDIHERWVERKDYYDNLEEKEEQSVSNASRGQAEEYMD